MQITQCSEIREFRTAPGAQGLYGVPRFRLARFAGLPHCGFMTDNSFKTIIEEVLHKLPDLLRSDLASRDPLVRESAEEILATKIMLGLSEHQDAS